ncbi:probable pectinesterase/pectinesterase inhibitor [Brassica rapa]|nr:probable pectinesterase/pectinesterase inhibitor [Brassica rapa]
MHLPNIDELKIYTQHAFLSLYLSSLLSPNQFLFLHPCKNTTMNVAIKLAFLFLTVTSTLTATPAKRPDYLSTQHAKTIAGICTVIQTDTSLCTKTLKEVPSDDPITLIRALPTAAESSVKKSVTFLIGIKPKHTSNAVATAAINSCEKNLNNALEDFAEFWKATGKDVTTLAHNYFTCKKTLTSIMGYHSTCLDDIKDKNLLKEVESGIGVGKNLSSNSFDVFNGLHTIFNTFAINVKLNEEDTSPRPPPLSDYYY